jgi:hypothetical protein
LQRTDLPFNFKDPALKFASLLGECHDPHIDRPMSLGNAGRHVAKEWKIKRTGFQKNEAGKNCHPDTTAARRSPSPPSPSQQPSFTGYEML